LEVRDEAGSTSADPSSFEFLCAATASSFSMSWLARRVSSTSQW